MPLVEASVSRFHPSDHVLSARAGDTVVLMDGRRGTYHTLNEVGGRVWELAGSGATSTEVVERLMQEYEVPRVQLEHDVAGTLRRLIEDRLLEATTTAAPSRVLEVPSVLRCGLLIAWFKGLLRVRGFRGTVEWIRRRVEPLPASSGVELEAVKAVEHSVAMAGALYPGRAKCLEQSLTLYYYLRLGGAGVTFRMGVQPHPFLAHAWVEYRHLPINDFPEHIKQFVVFPALPL